MTHEQIAKVAHEVNKAYCESQGDYSQPSWEEAPEWQKSSAINGVKFHIENPDATPENSHESCLKQKEEEDWKYGPVKNPETKEHPCFVPYAELPAAQKAKDYPFRQTVHSLKPQTTSELTNGQIIMSVQFNPGQREDVAAIKQIFADAYDEIEKWVGTEPESNKARLADTAKIHLETAQMYAVKAVTR